MIFFKPTVLTDNKVLFQAIENEVVCGDCTLRLSENAADIFQLNYDNDKPYLVEGLLKSAYNYAATKNFYIGSCSCKNITAFLKNMNFIEEKEKFFNDIPSILQGNCQSCHKN